MKLNLLKHLFAAVLLFLSALAVAQTVTPTINQTSITGKVSMAVLAGQGACQETETGEISFRPCDNTAVSPSAAYGVFTTSQATVGGTATIVINGVILTNNTIPFYEGGPPGGNCNTGDLLGDVDGTGNLADLGAPGQQFYAFPESYVGICQGTAVFHGVPMLEMVVQPGYLFPTVFLYGGDDAVRTKNHPRRRIR
jgi:hypothetical protein